MTTKTVQTAAAVDLGSNSFHMIVAQIDDGRVQVVDRMKDMVRLAAGLDEKQRLGEEVMARALDCLRRFGQRLQDIPSENVLAVGTNTLRQARNSGEFLAEAEAALGHPIGIISGLEEARLIYLGVSHSIEDDGKRRLVMDIGGGSTEFILGQQFKPELMESLYMGCVGMSRRFFADGVIDAKRLAGAEIAAMQELESMEAQFRRVGWETAIGASGSIIAIRDVVVQEGWSKEGITPSALKKLRKALIAAGHVDRLSFSGMQPERAAVFPGGFAVLAATFEALQIKRMRVSSGSLREGLLYDFLGRIHHEDVRERTIDELYRRHPIDRDQAAMVERTALSLLAQAARPWGLSEEEHGRLLRWAARLHEIGLAVAHSQYHKHGGYLLSNFDMPGFSRGEQRMLAALVRGHRRKFPEAEFKTLAKDDAMAACHLCVILRLAVLLHRSRSESGAPRVKLQVEGSAVDLRFPAGWLDKHPLTRADLQQEASYLKSAGVTLSFC